MSFQDDIDLVLSGKLMKGPTMKKFNSLITISMAFLCLSYSFSVLGKSEEQQKHRNDFTQCKEPRPEICTREYMPVCATKRTGIQCVTTPCPSTEEITYATGCTACADPNVIKYKQGPCE